MNYDAYDDKMSSYRLAEKMMQEFIKPLKQRLEALESRERQDQTAELRLQALPYSFDQDGAFNADKATEVAKWLAGEVTEVVANG